MTEVPGQRALEVDLVETGEIGRRRREYIGYVHVDAREGEARKQLLVLGAARRVLPRARQHGAILGLQRIGLFLQRQRVVTVHTSGSQPSGLVDPDAALRVRRRQPVALDGAGQMDDGFTTPGSAHVQRDEPCRVANAARR